MKKLLMVLLVATISLTALGEGFELRLGMDNGGEIINSDGDTFDIDSGGFVVRGEYLMGDLVEYGVGIANKSYAGIDDNDEYTATAQMIYLTGKLNLTDAGIIPYLRGNLGVTSLDGDAYEGDDMGMGLYYGIGLGAVVSNFLFELIYETQTATGSDSSDDDIEDDWTTTTLEFGYKFGAGN